jgi:hypothetical protein
LNCLTIRHERQQKVFRLSDHYLPP